MEERQATILNVVQETTKTQLVNFDKSSEIGIDALNLSLDLGFHRANISKDLNILWRNGILGKAIGRPTMYFDLSTIEELFPNVFVPSLLQLGEKLTDYLIKASNESEEITASFHLSADMEYALAALSYPPRGIPFLVYGDRGVGKTSFIRSVINRAKELKIIPNNASTRFINCRQNRNLSNLLADYKTNTIIIFEDIDHLDSESVALLHNLVYDAVAGGVNHFLGIIISSEVKDSQANNTSIYELLATKIYLPNFEEMPPIDKVSALNEILKTEARRVQHNLSFESTLFYSLCNYSYQNNYSGMIVEMQNILSKAYFKNLIANNDTLRVTYEDLPQAIRNFNNNGSFNHDIFFNNYIDDYVFYTMAGTSSVDKIITSNQDDLTASLTTFFDSFKTNCSNIKQSFSEISTVYSTLIMNDKLTRLHPDHISRINHLKYWLDQHPVYNKISTSDRSVFIVYSFLLYISLNANIFSDDVIDTDTIVDISKLNIFPSLSTDMLANTIIETVLIEALNEIKIRKTQLILLIDERFSTGIYEDILSNNESLDFSIQYLNPSISPMDTKKTIDSIIFDQLQISDTLVITDIYNVFRSRSLLKNSVPVSLEILYPLSLPLIDKCITNIRDGYSISDFKAINLERVDSISTESIIKNDEFVDFLELLNQNLLKKDLTFLDYHKTSPMLYESLMNICQQIDITVSHELIVKYVTHCSFMIERIIRNEPLNHPKLQQTYNKNKSIINVINLNFKRIEDTFGIDIPLVEVTYISEIFDDSITKI